MNNALLCLISRFTDCADGQLSTHYSGLYLAKPSQVYSGAIWVETAIDEC